MDRRRRAVALSLRLIDPEVRMLDELCERMGGATRTKVIEEALIRYLPVIAEGEGRYVDHGLAPAPNVARQYNIRPDVGEALQTICEQNGWQKNRIVRHALKELYNLAEAHGNGNSRR
jgi:predicted transcriptional regulator